MKSIHERIRAAQAAQDKARKAAEYKAGEGQRRSVAARQAAEVRKDNRLDALLNGRVEPRTLKEYKAMSRIEDDDAEFAGQL